MSVSSSYKIRQLIRALIKKCGRIFWSPGDCDEVMIGATPTRQTRWENVERALTELHGKGFCTNVALQSADSRDIEEAIRSTGFFRMKARRLKSLADFVEGRCGGARRMEDMPIPALSAKTFWKSTGSVKRLPTVSSVTVFPDRVLYSMPIRNGWSGALA